LRLCAEKPRVCPHQPTWRLHGAATQMRRSIVSALPALKTPPRTLLQSTRCKLCLHPRCVIAVVLT